MQQPRGATGVGNEQLSAAPAAASHGGEPRPETEPAVNVPAVAGAPAVWPRANPLCSFEQRQAGS